MKRIFLSVMVFAAMAIIAAGQNNMVATRSGDDYVMTISKKNFAAIFDREVAPYLSSSKSSERFVFDDLSIDDPDPSNNGSRAYLVLKASNSKETATIGVTLVKDIVTEQVTRLYIPSLGSMSSEMSKEMPTAVSSGDGGWKCSSIKPDCGGCRKVRENGVVVACPCYSGEGTCVFETAGGGGSNWPSWLTALITAILRMF
jgi:hypothetical protein